jgi:hypothetical protein
LTDSGYLFCGPRTVLKAKELKKELSLEAFTQEGTIAAQNPESPWYQASLFGHGSVLKDAEGRILKEVVIYQATDADFLRRDRGEREL